MSNWDFVWIIVDFLKRYILAIVFIAIIWWRLASKKKNKQEVPAPAKTQTMDNVAPHTKLHLDKYMTNKDTNLMLDDLRVLTAVMEQNSSDFEHDMGSEFESVNRLLKEVHDRKEEIRRIGLELEKIFLKYKDREKYLTTILMGLEKIKKERNNNQERLP